MRNRWIVLFALVSLVVVACDGEDADLTTDSTILTSPTETQAPDDDGSTTTTTTAGSNGEDTGSPSTTLVGERVTDYEVAREVPNENGVSQLIVIPNGAYTDVDLENFVFDLLEGNTDLYGIEIFDDEAAVEAFLTPEADRTEEDQELLDRHHFVSVTGRERIDYRGPFSEFPGGAIGS